MLSDQINPTYAALDPRQPTVTIPTRCAGGPWPDGVRAWLP
jgi:hypothetical protein